MAIQKYLFLTAKVCPYCHKPTRFMSAAELLKKATDDRMLWACVPCGAWVSCRKGTKVPLGRLGNEKLRKLRVECHSVFDPIWKDWIELGDDEYTARTKAYKWIAKLMGIEHEMMHFSWLTEEQCLKALDLMNEWLEKYPRFYL